MTIQTHLPLSFDISEWSHIDHQTPRVLKPALESKVNSFALRKFAEIVLALSVSLVISTVIPNTSILLCAVILTSALFQKVCLIAIEKLFGKLKDNGEEDPLDWGQRAARFSGVNLLMGVGPSIAIHESGHGVAAKLLFKKAQPIISIQPFSGGSTSWITSYGLTSLGKKFGKQGSMLIIAAAGAMASTFFAAGSFVLAERIKEAHPNMSQWLEWMAISQIAGDILYAFTTFETNLTKMSHDFVNLWVNGGIHPLIPIALMICIPLISKLAAAYLFDASKQPLQIQSRFSEK